MGFDAIPAPGIPKGTTIGEYTGKRRKTAPNDTDGGYSFGVNVYDEGRFIRRESRAEGVRELGKCLQAKTPALNVTVA